MCVRTYARYVTPEAMCIPPKGSCSAVAIVYAASLERLLLAVAQCATAFLALAQEGLQDDAKPF